MQKLKFFILETVDEMKNKVSWPKYKDLQNSAVLVLVASMIFAIVIGAGTGNPYFTTDSTASLRAIEIEADIVLKGTRVDGVYSADPEMYPEATRFSSLTFQDAYQKGLNIMDMTAFTLCQENNLPIIVFDMNKPGNLYDLVDGKEVGTLIN